MAQKCQIKVELLISLIILANCICSESRRFPVMKFKHYLKLFKPVEELFLHPNLPVLPNLSWIGKICPKKSFFLSFNREHMKAANHLKEMFSGMNSSYSLMKMAIALRINPNINPKLWYNALSSYLLGMPHKMSPFPKISPVEAMPDNFIFSRALQMARDFEYGRCVHVDETFAPDNGVESVLWYFREDVLINANHWYWHLMNPFQQKVRSDRIGELFYYYHQQLLARYNAERLANGLPRVKAFDFKVGAIIEEKCNSHISDSNAGYNWTDRPENTPFVDVLQNSNRAPNANIKVSIMEIENERLLLAINSGIVRKNNSIFVSLENPEGIDILGDLIQSTNHSINRLYYGGIHNEGHVIIGLSTDPVFERGLPPGIMLDVSVSMRDPIFYRWHKFIDDYFALHKKTLEPYTRDGGDFPLLWAGVSIKSVKVISSDRADQNELSTFWKYRRIRITHGLDFSRNQFNFPVYLCLKHLDHAQFKYQIVVDKKENVSTERATIRIFMAPRYKEAGEHFDIHDQRTFFIAMDSFTVSLKSGKNVIQRWSNESTLTIPWDVGFGELQKGFDNRESPNCGCGYPQHMLLPRGRKTGMTFDLFVMVTNGEEDAVPDTLPLGNKRSCKAAPLYCGNVNEKYPDQKPMDYPFDRIPHTGMDSTLDDFMAGISNMASVQVRIFHTDKIQRGPN